MVRDQVRSKGEEVRDSDGGESIATKDVDVNQKSAFEVDGARLHYTQEEGNIMTSILSCKGHHVDVHEQAVKLRKKESLYGAFLSHVCYERYCKDPQGIPGRPK